MNNTPENIKTAQYLAADLKLILKLPKADQKTLLTAWRKQAKIVLGYDLNSRPIDGLLYYCIKQIANSSNK